jgi:DNA primase
MSAKSSLFDKLRATVLSVGRSERTATRKARLLSSASFSDFTRLTPEQNVKLGLSPKARHYVLKTAKRVTKATPTISARQYETKRARELFGLAPEKATQARRQGAIRYVSADQRERVAKAAITREETKVIAEIKKFRASGEDVPSYSPDKRRHGSSHPVSEYAERRYRALRRRKLAGEHIPDGEWQWMIDYARRFKDPRYELLRGSPGAFGFSLTA